MLRNENASSLDRFRLVDCMDQVFHDCRAEYFGTTNSSSPAASVDDTPVLATGDHDRCASCGGSGRVKSPSTPTSMAAAPTNVLAPTTNEALGDMRERSKCSLRRRVVLLEQTAHSASVCREITTTAATTAKLDQQARYI